MHCAFLHEADDLVLHHNCVVNVIVELNCDLILELTILAQEVLIIDGVCKIYLVLRQQVNLTIGGPRVESVSHRVLRPNADVLSSSQKQEPMNLLVKALPVEDVWHPGQSACQV